MEEDKKKVEAVLFTTGRFMTIDEISLICGVGSKGKIKELLDELVSDYQKRESSLTLLNENDKWKLTIKKEYLLLTSKLLSDSEMDRPTQETLAVIAYKQPVLQSEVVKLRGNKAYDHIKYLRENEFINSEPHGRTRLLKLCPKFFDYFDVAEDSLKQNFENVENKYKLNMENISEDKEKAQEEKVD